MLQEMKIISIEMINIICAFSELIQVQPTHGCLQCHKENK